MLSQPTGQPAHMRPEQGRAQEKRVQVEPGIAVVSGAQVEMALPRMGQPAH
jgi:hypothetical protein